MLADLLTGLMNGLGFMTGVLVLYTVYDFIFTLIERHHEKVEAAKRRKRRRQKNLARSLSRKMFTKGPKIFYNIIVKNKKRKNVFYEVYCE